jgi:hypothetical protein
MWPALSGIDATFRNLFKFHYKGYIQPASDPVALRAEWLGNWVKQMCLTLKSAGMPEFIGKSVNVLTFNYKGGVRWFKLKPIEER